jgi:hypothetical protein
MLNIGYGIPKEIPAIIKPPYKNTKFNKWIKVEFGNMFSILILDVSYSMKKYYISIFNMAN